MPTLSDPSGTAASNTLADLLPRVAPTPCVLGLPNCTTDHGDPGEFSGALCSGLVSVVETGRGGPPVEVEAGSWTDEFGAEPLVWVAGSEMTAAAARRLVAVLHLAIERAERPTGTST